MYVAKCIHTNLSPSTWVVFREVQSGDMRDGPQSHKTLGQSHTNTVANSIQWSCSPSTHAFTATLHGSQSSMCSRVTSYHVSGTKLFFFFSKTDWKFITSKYAIKNYENWWVQSAILQVFFFFLHCNLWGKMLFFGCVGFLSAELWVAIGKNDIASLVSSSYNISPVRSHQNAAQNVAVLG